MINQERLNKLIDERVSEFEPISEMSDTLCELMMNIILQALFFLLSAYFTSYIMEKKSLQFGGIIMFEILVFIGISAIVGIPTYIIIDKFKDKLNSDSYHW